jgi:hypothetical protein
MRRARWLLWATVLLALLAAMVTVTLAPAQCACAPSGFTL